MLLATLAAFFFYKSAEEATEQRIKAEKELRRIKKGQTVASDTAFHSSALLAVERSVDFFFLMCPFRKVSEQVLCLHGQPVGDRAGTLWPCLHLPGLLGPSQTMSHLQRGHQAQEQSLPLVLRDVARKALFIRTSCGRPTQLLCGRAMSRIGHLLVMKPCNTTDLT